MQKVGFCKGRKFGDPGYFPNTTQQGGYLRQKQIEQIKKETARIGNPLLENTDERDYPPKLSKRIISSSTPSEWSKSSTVLAIIGGPQR